MTSAIPIRQPRGPSNNSFGSPAAAAVIISGDTSLGPPTADVDSLRRSNTFNSPRHQTSASISSTPAASSAFHGNKTRGGPNRFRSGSLTNTNANLGNDGGVVRRKSGREVHQEEVLVEEGPTDNQDVMKNAQWGKGGLSRQRSLPNRKGYKPPSMSSMPPPPLPDKVIHEPGPPPRPPRRIYASGDESIPSPPTTAVHNVSHSLSSLAMFGRSNILHHEETVATSAGLSRTQSLRAQAKHPESGPLGRSSSLRSTGEMHYKPSVTVSSPTESNNPQQALSSPTPPPASSTAALPPFPLPLPDNTSLEPGADVKRHQSLTQGYGRVRERLERSPALLTLEQRDEIRKQNDQSSNNVPTHARRISEAPEEEPPLSPLDNGVWSRSTISPADGGWSRQQQMQDAFEAMQLGRRMMGGDLPPQTKDDRGHGSGVIQEILANPLNTQQNQNGRPRAGSEEPSWVSTLVGGPERRSPLPPQQSQQGFANLPWAEREALLRSQGMNQRWDPNNNSNFIPQHMYLSPQSQQIISNPYIKPGQLPNLTLSIPGVPYSQSQPLHHLQPLQPIPANFQPGAYPYATPPPTAMVTSAQDQAVIELAKSKGLNPATFDCRPTQARFFVIKSYTEEDVQKSLKHEIWSSTMLGNRRLNLAFGESAKHMPIYLFFSVNGSRHFCGVAQMVSPVDENQTSTVWAQDKWKGIFKVKWIFVRDVPTAALRHIRLMNTPEKKPITNSRDTQELHYEAGCEVLQIFLDYQTRSKTSLLQDFAYYEQLAANKAIGQPSPSHIPQQTLLPPLQMSSPASSAQSYIPSPSPQFAQGGQVPPVPPIPSRFR
ncbi:hypothetical protein M231_00424 [Tremella mesenterica]|uniref:YTH domain-containing protein n=1 Tax=Tremella mesenterica TaxID=5217 RepID=A0A4Q1BW86_TREME|nr:hypothetical protein M231_00424 [Tremella mesenterica]